LATGDMKGLLAECGAHAGLWAMRMILPGDALTMWAGDAGRSVGSVEAKPANGDVGALAPAFRSTELSDGRLEAKPEKGDCDSLTFAKGSRLQRASTSGAGGGGREGRTDGRTEAGREGGREGGRRERREMKRGGWEGRGGERGGRASGAGEDTHM
jgi:hypothetical protein